MARHHSEIYLGKLGKIYGPFDEEEIRRFEKTGEIEKYVYRWDWLSASWVVLEAPPPPPAAALTPEERARPAPAQFVDALCRGSSGVLLRGGLTNRSQTGCDFVTDDRSDYPRLALGAPATLHVLDAGGAGSASPMRLHEILRAGGRWVYRFRYSMR